MAELVLAGRLDVESQSGKPTRGRGRIVLSESGVTWEVSKLLSLWIDHFSWSEVHTFGRDGGSLHIAWEKRFEGPASKLPAALTFDGDRNSSKKAIDVARVHLPSQNWRSVWTSPDARLDEVWARDWGSLPPPPSPKGPRRQGTRQARTTLIVLGIATVLILGLMVLVVIDKQTNLVSGVEVEDEGAPAETGPTLADPTPPTLADPTPSPPTLADPTPSHPATADCVEDEIPNLPVDEADACLTQIANERGYVADPQQGVFVVAYSACSAHSVEELAKEFLTDPTPGSVAEAYSAYLFGPEAQGAARDGCLLALT
jgi:hypothetical protein